MIKIAEPEPEPPNSVNDGGAVLGCLLISFVTSIFFALPLLDFIFKWWFQ